MEAEAAVGQGRLPFYCGLPRDPSGAPACLRCTSHTASPDCSSGEAPELLSPALLPEVRKMEVLETGHVRWGPRPPESLNVPQIRHPLQKQTRPGREVVHGRSS